MLTALVSRPGYKADCWAQIDWNQSSMLYLKNEPAGLCVGKQSRMQTSANTVDIFTFFRFFFLNSHFLMNSGVTKAVYSPAILFILYLLKFIWSCVIAMHLFASFCDTLQKIRKKFWRI